MSKISWIFPDSLSKNFTDLGTEITVHPLNADD